MVTGGSDSGEGVQGNRPRVTVADLVRVLEAEVVCCEDHLGRSVLAFAASDLLSDVLAFEKQDYALLTGLTNAQIVRTADITGASCIVIVRNKKPQQAAVALAQASGIPIILVSCSMFEACAQLSRLAEPHHDAVPRTSDPSGP
jgi:predicted transcriptional regulator